MMHRLRQQHCASIRARHIMVPSAQDSTGGAEQCQELQAYSYMLPSFVDFYDCMVDTVYDGIHSPDMLVFKALLDQRLDSIASSNNSRQELYIVDLGCGSGRLILALLHHLAEADSQQSGLQEAQQTLEQEQQRRQLLQQEGGHVRLHIFGVDDSGPMLARAAAKVDAFMEAHPELKPRLAVTWVQSAFQSLSIPALEGPRNSSSSSGSGSGSGSGIRGADLVLMAVGGLHHVCSTAEVQEALVRMRRHLAPGGVLALGYLTWSEICREDGADGDAVRAEAFRVGQYERQRLHYKVEHHEDGSQTVYERFRLSTLGPDGAVVACVEEDWRMRRLEEDELLQLAAVAGLAPVDASCVPAAALQGQREGRFLFLQAR